MFWGVDMAVKPVIISDEGVLVGLLRGRRQALGISQGELDDRLGWPDGYSAKAEAPERKYGRRVAWGISSFLSYWLEGLGLSLVLMDKAEAEAMVASSRAEPITESGHTPYAGRNRKREVHETRVLRMAYVFPGRRAA